MPSIANKSLVLDAWAIQFSKLSDLVYCDSVKSITRIHGWWTKKISDRANYQGQLVLTVHGERRLRRIVRSQRSQTLAQITTHLNDGASRKVSKWTVQRSLPRMGFGSRRSTRVPLLNARH
ncbi:HTH_Tnp_Tc3_2 domain-containing protein [Trichonephila clavipes]|nr:HTH_Tnp_Tc3_2 domain-containing protein [Trichonephila clavipes]